MPDLLRDLRWAVRSLGRTPLFAAVAVVTLALGIGLNATIFTVVNSILLRPLPVERPDELVHVYTSWTEEPFATSSYPDYLDLRDGAPAFAGGRSSGLLGHASAIATLQHGGRSEVLIGEIVTGNAFQVLGVGAARGRMLLPEDDRPEAPRVVVLGQGLWRRRFGGAPAAAVGRRFWSGGVDTEPFEVVGVAADTKVRSVGEAPRPMVHFARGQRPDAYGNLLAATAAGDATPLAGELRRLALELDPELAFTETRLPRRQLRPRSPRRPHRPGGGAQGGVSSSIDERVVT